jgi:hypothetical protein
MTDQRSQPIDFNAFILSLGSSALIHLGLAQDPTSKEKAKLDLPLAQQSIDLLALVQEKTRGTLTHDEESFLRNLLYDLRMRFVEVAKEKK